MRNRTQAGTGDAATEAVSQAGNYGFVDGSTTGEGSGINGVGGGVGSA
jgi:hypothetical protein